MVLGVLAGVVRRGEGGVSAASSWIGARPDRADLVAWLTKAAATHRSAFYDAALTTVLNTGRMTDPMERAVRHARARSVLLATRDCPETVGKKARAA